MNRPRHAPIVRAIVALNVAVLLSACASDVVSSDPTRGPTLLTPASAAGAPATGGFSFLAPTVRAPSVPGGTFDATRTPTVRVSCVSATGPACPVVRTFVTGPGTSDIRVDAANEAYRLTWATPSNLEVGAGRYRVDVLDGSTLLGSAPVRVSITTRDAALAGDQDIAIIRGKSVVITFRIAVPPSDDALVGPANEAAVAVVPDRVAPMAAGDFDRTHPELLGLSVSFNTVLVRLRATATIGETNALIRAVEGTLIGGSRGIAGRVPAMLVLRFSTTTHAQLQEKLLVLRASPAVLGAVPEAQLETHALPVKASLTVPANWLWDLRPAISGNWGLKTARVPQMWNLNRHVRREGERVRVAVLEPGTIGLQSDLSVEARLGDPDALPDRHKTAVAGVIGARHDNGGVDGVTPFARLVDASSADDFFAVNASIQELRALAAANVRVVNASFGFNWSGVPGSIATIAQSETAASFMNVLGAMVADAFVRLEQEGARLPLYVASAGNDSDARTRFPASLSGPLQNAGLTQGVSAIVVVESVQRVLLSNAPLEQRIILAVSSGLGGHVSAAGQEIMSTGLNGEIIESISGTSFSAPLVAGVASYVYSMYPTFPAPTVASNRLRELLIQDAVPVPANGAPGIDALAVLMNADVVMGEQRAFRVLLDIDDGSFDGNQRTDLKTNAEIVVDSVGGDDQITMRDFRRWRDWQLDADGVLTRVLNGRADHPARDLNLDRLVSTDMDIENVYPRGDFNGDGRISSTRVRALPAALGGREETDLMVMQQLFADSLYQPSELPGLLTSADIEVRTNLCTDIGGATRSVTRVLRPDGSVYKELARVGSPARQIFTVPEISGKYRVEVEVFDVGGLRLGRDARELPSVLRPGEDLLFEASCMRLQLGTTAALNVSGGVPTAVSVTATLVDPLRQTAVPADGATVSATATNASITPTSGTTTQSGSFTLSATPSTTASTMTIVFTVQINGLAESITVERPISNGPPPPAGLGTQIVSGFLAGTPSSPIRYRARVTSIPNSTVVWTATARSDGSGFIQAGPAQALIVSVAAEGPFNVDQFRLDSFATLTYLPNTRVAGGITITMRACVFVGLVQVLQTSGQPLCQTVESFFR